MCAQPGLCTFLAAHSSRNLPLPVGSNVSIATNASFGMRLGCPAHTVSYTLCSSLQKALYYGISVQCVSAYVAGKRSGNSVMSRQSMCHVQPCAAMSGFEATGIA